MYVVRSLAALVLIALVPGLVLAQQYPRVNFEGEEKTNPSSPKPGQLKATGTYELTPEYTLKTFVINFRLEGAKAWNRIDDKVKTGKKDGKLTWEFTLPDLPAGKYEVRVRMEMKDAADRNRVLETEPTRFVQVKGK